MVSNILTKKDSKVSEGQELSLPKITVIGLGYVGLPLAVSLARHFPITGFDINEERISQLQNGFDCTREIEEDKILNSKIKLSANFEDIIGQDIYIVTVPTPVTHDNLPESHAT